MEGSPRLCSLRFPDRRLTHLLYSTSPAPAHQRCGGRERFCTSLRRFCPFEFYLPPSGLQTCQVARVAGLAGLAGWTDGKPLTSPHPLTRPATANGRDSPSHKRRGQDDFVTVHRDRRCQPASLPAKNLVGKITAALLASLTNSHPDFLAYGVQACLLRPSDSQRTGARLLFTSTMSQAQLGKDSLPTCKGW